MSGKESVPTENLRYFSGRELIERWRIHPRNLSDCMILGLQAYHPDDLSVVVDPRGLNDGKRQSAWSNLTRLSGLAEGAERPKRFQSNVPSEGRIYPLPLWLRDEKDSFFRIKLRDKEYLPITITNLIDAHMELWFRSDDVKSFEQAYGLVPSRIEDEGARSDRLTPGRENGESADDPKMKALRLADELEPQYSNLGDLSQWVCTNTEWGKNLSIRTIRQELKGRYPDRKAGRPKKEQ